MVTPKASIHLQVRSLLSIAIIAICSIYSIQAFAEVAKGPKRTAAEWGAAWEAMKSANISDEGGLAYISRIAVVKKATRGFEVLPLEQKDADEDSFMAIPIERELNLARFVNKRAKMTKANSKKANPCEVSHRAIAQCWELDAILDITGEKWRLLRFMKEKKSFETLLEAPAGTNDEYFKWIHSQLNYDGVIVDVEGDYLLVLLPPGRQGTDIQALTLQDSAARIVLPTSTAKGTSLLQLTQRSGRFAIFLPVIMSADAAKSFVKGSKLIIEKGK